MSSGANVGSIEAVRDFRASMNTFVYEARDALATYDMEVQRTLDYLLESAPAFWQNEFRKAEAVVTQAKIDLQRCRAMPLPGGGQPACLEERKLLERALKRQQYVEEKIQVVRKIGHMAEREAQEYKGRSNQLSSLLDSEVPRSINMLDRVLKVLESYVAMNHPPSDFGPTETGAGDNVARALPVEPAAPGKKEGEATPESAGEADQSGASPTDPAHTTSSGPQ